MVWFKIQTNVDNFLKCTIPTFERPDVRIVDFISVLSERLYLQRAFESLDQNFF